MLKTAVLLVNLGSPNEPTEQSISAYLYEFLSDRRVVDFPSWIWRPILRWVILRKRPIKLLPKYKAIWQNAGAPLKAITEQQAQLLSGYDFTTYWAMRYQHPSIAEAVKAMQNDGVERVVVLPLYPQFSHTTTSTVYDELNRVLVTQESKLHIVKVLDYHENLLYIDALKASIQAYWLRVGRPNFCRGEKLILSFHGLPIRNIERGDPYQKQCERTYQLLIQALDLTTEHVILAYQSRFGSQKWLQPSTQGVLTHLASQQCSRVDVVCPGFAADCLETLDEVAIELKTIFEQSGGHDYHYIPCLNDNAAHIEMMVDVLKNKLHHSCKANVNGVL